MVTGAGETRSEMRGEGDRERVPCWRSCRQFDQRHVYAFEFTGRASEQRELTQRPHPHTHPLYSWTQHTALSPAQAPSAIFLPSFLFLSALHFLFTSPNL